MKRTTAKLCLILAVMMLISMLAACSNTAAPSASAASTLAPSAVASVAPSAEASAAPSAPPTKSPATKMTLFVNMTWFWTDKWEGLIPEAITEKTGVSFDVTRAADDKQLGLMIASGDLTDMIFDGDNVSRLSDASVCYAFQDLISKYTPNWKPDPAFIQMAASKSSDGKYYTLLDEMNTTDSWRKAPLGAPYMPTAFYRSDLLKELGNPPLKTLDDFLSVCAMAKTKWPDMVPVIMDYQWLTRCFRVWNGVADESVYQSSDSTLHYCINNPNYKQYLQYVNKLYRSGYIIAENFAFKSIDENHAYTYGGKAFFTTYCSGVGAAGIYTNEIQKTIPTATYEQTMNLGGDKSDFTRQASGWAGTFITKSCKTPDVAIKFCQFMNSEEGMKLGEWGRPGTDYTMDSTGIPKYSQDFMDAYKDTTVLYKKYNPSWIFFMDPVVESVGRAAAAGNTVDTPQDKEIRSLVVCNTQIPLCMPKADSDADVIYQKLQTMVKDQEVKIFLSKSDAEFEANYQTLMTNAKTIGVDSFETAINANRQALK